MVNVKIIGAGGFGGTGMIELLLGHPEVTFIPVPEYPVRKKKSVKQDFTSFPLKTHFRHRVIKNILLCLC